MRWLDVTPFCVSTHAFFSFSFPSLIYYTPWPSDGNAMSPTHNEATQMRNRSLSLSTLQPYTYKSNRLVRSLTVLIINYADRCYQMYSKTDLASIRIICPLLHHVSFLFTSLSTTAAIPQAGDIHFFLCFRVPVSFFVLPVPLSPDLTTIHATFDRFMGGLPLVPVYFSFFFPSVIRVCEG